MYLNPLTKDSDFIMLEPENIFNYSTYSGTYFFIFCSWSCAAFSHVFIECECVFVEQKRWEYSLWLTWACFTLCDVMTLLCFVLLSWMCSGDLQSQDYSSPWPNFYHWCEHLGIVDIRISGFGLVFRIALPLHMTAHNSNVSFSVYTS